METFAKYKKVVLFHILTQKTLTSVGVNCTFIYNCYSNRTYMHGYCSTCINILVIVSLSLSLLLSPHSPWSTSHHCHTKNSSDQHTTAADQHQTTRHLIKSPPITLRFSHLIKIKPLPSINSLIKIKPLPPINIKPMPHKAWSNRRWSTH